MANYPFKINIDKGDGNQATFYTSSFATDAESLVSSSLIIDKINAIPAGATYIQSEEAVAMHPARRYGHTTAGGDASDEGILFLSASCTDANTGSISFTDTETTTNGGLNFYTFWGTKVCNVLGLPEGIPIYTENFKLSDDSSNPDNYLSGDVIANGVAVKEAFKMAPQARMRSNIVWDEVFGEGYLQWVSGSNSELKIGYDTINDKYKIQAAAAPTFEISGVDTLTATTINGSLLGSVDVSSGTLSLGETNATAVTIGNASNTVVNTFNAGAAGHVFQTGFVDIEDTTDATDATGDTGALRVEGGVSIAKKLFVGTDLDVDGTTNLDAVDIDGAVNINGDVTFVDAGSTDTIVKIHDSNDDGLVDVYANNAVKIRLHGNGFSHFSGGDIGFGTDTQGSGGGRVTIHDNGDIFPLTVIQARTTNDSGDGIRIDYTGAATPDTSAHCLQALDSTDDVWFEVRGDNAGGHSIGSSFTAGHDTACLDEAELMPGLIIESTGEVWCKPTGSFEVALPFTQLTNSNGSKKVFGVINGWPLKYDVSGSIYNVDEGHENYVKNGYYMKPSFTAYGRYNPTGSENRQLNTMSIGEGVVWVTNINGEIENGDYIESSVIKGYGRKQDDDILRSKTVAKCTEAINWTEVTSSIQYSGSAYKKYLTAVTFHCG